MGDAQPLTLPKTSTITVESITARILGTVMNGDDDDDDDDDDARS